ncbi:hypothetical protein H7K45_23990 [Mycobacterium yunnanensis]|uniref:Uncharacterized protein n=1 Tax=Mycobacterium yunnanensis TaxID=368477 RepID=A0A9X3C3U5_9MYCO|nr:hypothetical protein [Mycobacterium yunnanensis]MCV7423621.1 hypothetical protein [Mycobacterium yunnanensis]
MTASRLHGTEPNVTGLAETPIADADTVGQRIIFTQGAPVPLSRTRAALRWMLDHRHVHLPHHGHLSHPVHLPHAVHLPHHVHLPHLPPPKPQDTAWHASYVEQALMSREMYRL